MNISFSKARIGFFQKLGCLPESFQQKLNTLPRKNRLWLHAVSVGELNAAQPLIQALEKQYSLILSTTTQTGQNLAKQRYPHLPIFYFPFELPWAIASILTQIQPIKILMMETEIWPCFLCVAHRHNIPVYMINGRLSERSFRSYHRFRWFFKPVLSKYTRLLMQSETDSNRMIALGAPPDRVISVGNMKFDYTPIESMKNLKQEFHWQPEDKVLVFASTHAGEDELFIELGQKFPQLKIILAPRHPQRVPEVSALLTKAGVDFTLRTHLKPSSWIVLDTIGELRDVFAMSTLAVMGGSFVPSGGHNPLEPIQAKIPVIFGPHMQNFQDVARMVLAEEAGFQAQSIEEAESQIEHWLTDNEAYHHTVRQGQQLLTANQGTTEKIIKLIT
jgi:3-deoxy-D-manno-octulosonic-acid transferase